MPSRLLIALSLGAALIAAEPARGLVAGSPPPWTPSFTTQLRGKDRLFVELAGKTYILVVADEIATGLGDGQDIALTGKLRKLPGGKFGIYRIDGLTLDAIGEALAGRLDGDNIYVVGNLTGGPKARIFSVRAAAPAPSDSQMLQSRLSGIPDDDWDRRLGVVSWCRDQARIAGNADFWSATADSLMGKVVEDLASRAAEHKDMALVTRALDLALNQLRDQGLAARVASPVWIREHGGQAAEAVARRMRGLGYALYKDTWSPRPQALESEYEDRFKAMNWKDAEGFYRLGRWADENAESLPRARERSWRCYQSGNAADPSHVGIARELGIAPRAATGTIVAGVGTAVAPAADLIDSSTGLRVPAPQGWRRGPPSGDGSTWLDPNSETALITVRVLRPPVEGDAQWAVLSSEARGRQGFIETAASQQESNGRRQSNLRYTWTEGEQQRFSALILVVLPDGPAAVLEARGLPIEQTSLDHALDATVAGIGLQGAEARPSP